MDAQNHQQANPAITQWVILGLGLLLLGGFVGGNLYYERANTEAREQERLLLMTRIVQQITDENLIALNSVLEDLSKDLSRSDTPARDMNHRLATLTDALSGVRTLMIIDKQGVIRASNRPELVGKPSTQQAHIQDIRQKPDPGMLYITPPFTTQLGVFSLNASRMIREGDGGFGGFVSATLDPQFFIPLLGSVLYAPDMWAMLVHTNGALFLMVPDREGVAGKNLAQPGTLFSRHRDSGLNANVFSDMVYATGETSMLATRTIAPPALKVDSPLMIGISSNLDRVFGNWRREMLFQGALFLLIVLASCLALTVFQKRQRHYALEMSEAARAVADSEHFLRTIANNIPAMVAYWDKELKCTYANNAYQEWFGKSPEQMRGISLQELLGDVVFSKNEPYIRAALQGEPQRFERTLVKADGSTGYTLARYIPDLESGQARGFFVLVSDITELKVTQIELEQRVQELDILARTDPLTGINNRRHFLERAEEELSRSKRYGFPLVFLMLDIDHFKIVNDTHGHDAGDEVLKSLASVFREVLRSTDIFGRVGGEEFAAIFIQTELPEAKLITERLRQTLQNVCLMGKGGSICFTVSIGLAASTGDDDSIERIMKRADIALFEAKAAGRNRVRFYDEQ